MPADASPDRRRRFTIVVAVAVAILGGIVAALVAQHGTGTEVSAASGPTVPAVEQTRPTDVDAVRAAFEYVYTSSTSKDIDTSVGLIEDGESLRGTILDMRARYPEQSTRTEVEVVDVTLDSPRHATVRYELTTVDYRSGVRDGAAVFDGDRWRIARDTFCDSLRAGGGICPPSAGEAPQ